MSAFSSLFDRRFGRVRQIDVIAGLFCAGALVFAYVAKSSGDRQQAEIAKLERQIAEDRHALRLLRAQAAELEQPERLENLAKAQLGLTPTVSAREIPEAKIAEVSRGKGRP